MPRVGTTVGAKLQTTLSSNKSREGKFSSVGSKAGYAIPRGAASVACGSGDISICISRFKIWILVSSPSPCIQGGIRCLVMLGMVAN